MSDFNIANLCPSASWGGLEMNSVRLSCWLTQRGLKIITFCIKNSPLWNECREKNLPVIEFNSTSKLSDIRSSFKLAKELKKQNCRILITNLNRNLPMTTLSKKIASNYFKQIYVQHMHIGMDKKDMLHNWMFDNIDIWVTPIPFLRNKVLEKTNIPDDKIKLIPFGIEEERFITDLPDKSLARDRLNLPKDAVIASVIGRIDPQKGQHLLIEAAKMIHEKNNLIHILIVGSKTANEETGYYEQLKSKVTEFQLDDFVHFREFQKDASLPMAAIDIFCMTTNSETYGMVTLEAMGAEKIVIGSNAGGTVDLIDDNVTGLLFNTGDAKSLAEKIQFCLENKLEASRLAVNGRKKVIEQFTSQRQTDLWLDLIQSLSI